MINSRGKRVVREAVFLPPLSFVRVEDKNLNEIRFRSDVYKMLSEPGKSAPYAIPDTKFDNFRRYLSLTVRKKLLFASNASQKEL